VFKFDHPNWQQPIDNSRSITLTFNRPAAQGSGVLHGFAGYFESVLYGGEPQAERGKCSLLLLLVTVVLLALRAAVGPGYPVS
jgi:hypothetical protein